MKIRIIQKDINDLDYLKHLDRAAKEPVDLICFNELATSGCLYQFKKIKNLDTIFETLKPYNFGIMIGFPHQTPQGLFNAYLYYFQGNHQIYHKINLFHPFGEHLLYEPGRQPGLFEAGEDRFGVAICYDLRFGDIFTQLKAVGATKIFVPAAFPRDRIDDWRELLIERAKSNRVYILGINSVGNDNRNEFGGSSMVVNPEGVIVAQADETSDTFLTVNI